MVKEIKCAHCGQPFIARTPNAKYCPDCRIEAYRAANCEREKAKRAQRSSVRNETRKREAVTQKPAPTGPAIKTVDSHCNGCVYLTLISCDATKNRACYYMGETGTRRPCPAGKGCTVRETGKRKASCVLPAR